jgi:hypothetical protein
MPTGPMRLLLLMALLGVPLIDGGAQVARPDSLAWRKRVLGVYDPATGEPIEGVRVLDVKNGNSSLTTVTGTVTLAFLPSGTSTLHIQKIGYKTTTIEISISPSDTSPLTVELEKTAVTLSSVKVLDSVHYFSPALQGFMARSKLHQGGQFITEVELRKHDNQRITSMVRRLPGITIDCPRTGVHRGECTAISTRLRSSRGRANCPLAVYIDGVSSYDNDLEKLAVTNFSGIELYDGAASVPPQYNKSNNICGVLLLWTREGE